MADNKLFKVKIISPTRVFYDGEVNSLELNTTEGEAGIYANHIPMTLLLAPGILTLHEESGMKNAAVHSGFIEILGDHVTILAESAEWPDEIDIHRAEEAKVRAERRLHGEGANQDMARAEMALKRSLVRLGLKKGN